MPESAVLLVNLGSPSSTAVPDVRRYLREFLGDERVLDLPAPLRWLLLEGIILRTRPSRSAHAYTQVWTPEGAPLLVFTDRLRAALEAATGATVVAGMRYGEPSIAAALGKLRSTGVEHVLLIPQYPHYAMSSWETVVVRVHEEATRVAPGLRFTTVQPFFDAPGYIDALLAVAQPDLAAGYDHLLFSFHGLPVRHLRKADCSRAHCQRVADCCNVASPAHATCYRAQCLRTVQAFARRAALPAGRFSFSFQSRLAGERWMEPFTDRELVRLARAGARKLLIMTPAFTADCLETLEEIAMTGRRTFLDAGGREFKVIPCLNDHPAYVAFLAGLTRDWLGRPPGRNDSIGRVGTPIGSPPQAV